MPPKDGIAMGTMMSDPLPVEVSTGMRASMVVAVVIKHGLTRLMAASIVALLPVLIIFFMAQKYFVKGIILSGIKG